MCIRDRLITHNPCVGISAKGGKASKKKDALTDQQVAVLLDTVKGLPPYLDVYKRQITYSDMEFAFASRRQSTRHFGMGISDVYKRQGDRWMRSSFTESIQRLPSIVRNGC